MDTLIGVGYFIGVILVFSLYLTFGEFMDRLDSIGEGKKAAILDLFKYWPISIWLIVWNGIKDEFRYGRLTPLPKEKKGGQIEE